MGSRMTEEPQSPTPGTQSNTSGWERETLEKLLFATLQEQRQSRRWSTVFKALGLLYVGITLWLVGKPMRDFDRGDSKFHTAVVDVSGMIAPGQQSSADNIIEGLRDAAEDSGTRGIILRMNTPGGSPVQSAYVYDEIRRLKKLKPELPIHAVVADMCASGGYYIAAAADRIYVSPASIVGSIGVIMGSFGFVDTMKKLGIERRIMTAGAHKALLDPFAPVDPVAKKHLESVLAEIHRQFIDAVKRGRGDRLKETPELFSGLIWTGEEGIRLGLADALGSTRQVAEEVIGAKKLVNFTPEENLLERFSRRLGTTLAAAVAGSAGQDAAPY